MTETSDAVLPAIDRDKESTLLCEALGGVDDTPPLQVSRQLKDRRDQGTSLVERSLLGGLSQETKNQLIDWMSTEASANFAVGALLGLAVGDWVGAPLEFLPAVDADAPAESRWDHDKFQCENPNTNEKERGVLQAGQWTDDTSMALCLADSLIVCRGLDGSDLRRRFWSWHAEGYNNTFRFDPVGSTNTPEKAPRSSFGLGYNIAKSILALEPGAEVTPQFINPGSNDSGNGGLMRLAPVPVFFAARALEEAMEAAGQSSLATHPGELATETAKCLAFILHRAINLEDSSRAEGARAFLVKTCDEYADTVRQSAVEAGASGRLEVATALQELRSLLLSEKPPDGTEACWNWRSPLPLTATLKARGEKYNGHPVSRPYFGSYCMDGLAMALNAVADTTTFHHAVARAVNFLGDADTVGAIAGQIAGAFYGYKGIDPRYVTAIRQWDKDEIACRAIICYMIGRSLPR